MQEPGRMKNPHAIPLRLLQQTHYCSNLELCRAAARSSSNAVCHPAQASWRSWPLPRVFHLQHNPLTPSFFPFQGGPVLKGSGQIYTFIVRYNKSYQLVHLILWQQSITFIRFRLVWNWAESISWKACLDWQTPEADAAGAVIPNKKMPWEISNNKETLNRPQFRTALWARMSKIKWWRLPAAVRDAAFGAFLLPDPPLKAASPGWIAEKAKGINRKTL